MKNDKVCPPKRIIVMYGMDTVVAEWCQKQTINSSQAVKTLRRMVTAALQKGHSVKVLPHFSQT